MNTDIRVLDDVAHKVGAIMTSSSSPGKGQQSSWYPHCMVHLVGRGQLVRIDLDAPMADYPTCLWCAVIRS